MRATFYVAIIISLLVWQSGCKKEAHVISNAGCDNSVQTVRQISDHKATVAGSVGSYYLVEDGAIDSRLVPCNLPVEFQQTGLHVQFSADVKATIQLDNVACCRENIVLTNIAK